jgi:predicted MPP superfamily phosphohydrolase
VRSARAQRFVRAKAGWGLKLQRVAIIPDTHCPYHDKRAWKLLIKVLKKWRPRIIVIQGDFGDFYTVSDFSKDPRRVLNLEWEIDEVNKLLDEIQELGAEQVIFISGNHEARLDRFIQKRAPELHGLVSIKAAFRIKDRGWVYVPYRDHYKLGKVYITHDVNATGRNAVHKIIDTYQHSAITAHTHRIGYAVEADGLGQPILSATFGWLGDLSKVDYQHKILATKAYVLGFGVGYLDEDGLLFANPVPIIKYRCLVEGKVYAG